VKEVCECRGTRKEGGTCVEVVVRDSKYEEGGLWTSDDEVK